MLAELVSQCSKVLNAVSDNGVEKKMFNAVWLNEEIIFHLKSIVTEKSTSGVAVFMDMIKCILGPVTKLKNLSDVQSIL